MRLSSTMEQATLVDGWGAMFVLASAKGGGNGITPEPSPLDL
jgi:hypothetical protein